MKAGNSERMAQDQVSGEDTENRTVTTPQFSQARHERLRVIGTAPYRVSTSTQFRKQLDLDPTWYISPKSLPSRFFHPHKSSEANLFTVYRDKCTQHPRQK
jgi:hypothetical protein